MTLKDNAKKKTSTIQLTTDRKVLWFIYGDDYADKNLGKTYSDATIRDDGWADSDLACAKFPPNAFTIVEY
jgi:hypothetical protein